MTLDEIIFQPDWWDAPDNDECVAEGCTQPALGVLYYQCGDPNCCAPPQAFYCEKHLVEMYATWPAQVA